METKIKIPFTLFVVSKRHLRWLMLPIFLVAAQGVGFIAANFSLSQPVLVSQAEDLPQVPTVLGATIDIRGEQPDNISKPSLVSASSVLDRVSADSFLIYDAATGSIIAERKPSEKMSVASLTKLMTGLLAYEYLDFSQSVTISGSLPALPNPKVKFLKGDTVRVEDIFNSMIVGSTNDSAYILAQEVAKVTGKNFVALMNEKAAALGMSRSHFNNPMGFDSQYNYSTAEDMRKLVDQTQKFSVFTNLSRTQSFSFSGSFGHAYQVLATNKLLAKYKDLEAIKTGYTENSQGAMVVKVTADNHEVIIILLSSQNRERDTLLLRDAVIEGVEWR